MKRYTLLISMLCFSMVVFCQNNTYKCNLPIYATPDSLFDFALFQIQKKMSLSEYYRQYTREYIKKMKDERFCDADDYNFDTLYLITQKYIISKVGEQVYCEYFDVSLNSFSCKKNSRLFGAEYYLNFGFSLPNILKGESDDIDKSRSSYERVNLQIKYKEIFQDNKFCDNYRPLQEAGDTILIKAKSPEKKPKLIKIIYPNFPTCVNGDCGFKITKDEAISIAKKNGIIKKDEKYSIEISTNNNWSWLIKTTTSEDEFSQYYIDLKDGKILIGQKIKTMRL